MLLETLDVRRNDVLIFSQNKFDFEDNFKIVFKKEEDRRPRKITYFEVCEFIKEPSPKNMILYRLLTNVDNLDAYSTKYGYFVNIASKMELVYFDPIFAIKDLRHLRFDIEPDKFRFKIQQFGVNFSHVRDSEPIYKEVYSFDLTADEAQNQNDKIFADAIFVFDDSYHGEVKIPAPVASDRLTLINELDEGADVEEKIVEDNSSAGSQLQKAQITGDKGVSTKRDSKVELLKIALGLSEDNENLRQFKESSPENNKTNYGETSVFDLFKTTSKTTILSKRDKDSIILKLKNSTQD